VHEIKVHTGTDHIAGKQRVGRGEPKLANLLVDFKENGGRDII